MSERSRSEATLAARAEAAAWMARLRGPDRAPEVDRGFRRWLQASAEHERAFEALSDRIEVLERLRTRTPQKHWHRPTPRSGQVWSRALLVAATIAAVMLVVVLYPLFSGVSTAVGEQRTLVLEDGSRIYLNTNSKVHIDYDARYRRLALDRGEALFEVAKDAQRPFIVEAGDRHVRALGTTFVVRRDSNAISVMLVEGKVEVVPQREAGEHAASSTVLLPGQRLTVPSEAPPIIDAPAIERVTAWRQGQVAFADAPLAEAVEEMNRYSAVKIIVDTDEVADVRVGGFFRMGDSASFARAVAQTYGFDVVESHDGVVLKKMP